MLKIDNEDFVYAWLKSTTIQEVADKIGITAMQVYGKAAYLRERERGVDLPPKPRNVRRIDVEGLNSLIASHTKKQHAQNVDKT